MTARLWRLRMVVAAGLGFTALLGAALLFGRALATPLVGVDLTAPTDLRLVRFAVIDVNRPMIVSTRIGTPGKAAAVLDGSVMRIVQRVRRVEQADITYSEADVKTGAWAVRMTVTAGKDDLLTPADFAVLGAGDSRRWRVYLPESGEVWESAAGRPRARLVVRLSRYLSDVVWIDAARYMTAGLDGIAFGSLDGAPVPTQDDIRPLAAALRRFAFAVRALARFAAPADAQSWGVAIDPARSLALGAGSLTLVDRTSGTHNPLVQTSASRFFLMP